MKIAELRERVRMARAEEASDDNLRTWLAGKRPQLHHSIYTRDDASSTLFNFVQTYIERVPDMLEAAYSVAGHANLHTQLMPVLKVAETFFLQPAKEISSTHRGLLLLLDEAYLAHRLVEEVNDRYVAHGGESLIPLNNTRANLIVHELLGEEYSNRLDSAVYEAVAGLLPEGLFESAEFIAYKQAIGEQDRHALWRRWPNMAEELGIGLSWRDNL